MVVSQHSIGFGTSGLRGHARGFSHDLVGAYVGAFLDVACAGAAERTVWIGADLRASSPAIAEIVALSVSARGWTPRYGGAVPTPALAHYALRLGVPAIMVTGSHIPADYNGLKFYRPDGELLKSDEAAIREAVKGAGQILARTPPSLPPVDPDPARAYLDRYTEAFAPDVLNGLRIGVFEHSAVGRDGLVAVLEALGARCTRLGRNKQFVAVDTEAVLDEHMAVMRQALTQEGLDCIVSTDGDGDRPLVLEENGQQINGDVLGALTALSFGADTVVTPLTSTSAIEMSGWFGNVVRTHIGSPFVVEAMAGVRGGTIAGFEANGGFFLGSDVNLAQGRLSPLPTRDAVLPILAVLAQSANEAVPLSTLAARLPERVMKSDRLKHVAHEEGTGFVTQLAISRDLRSQIDESLADPSAIDIKDGTRLVLPGGTIVHFRQSGNAPELRCYVETGSARETDRVLGAMMGRVSRYFGKGIRE